MRLFGSEKYMNLFNAMEGEAVHHKMLSAAVEQAQKRIEGNNFAIRKNLLEYDQVMNEQREMVYGQRRRVLAGEDMKDQILSMVEDQVNAAVDAVATDELAVEDWNLLELNQLLLPVVPVHPVTRQTMEGVKKVQELKDKIKDEAFKLYEAKEAEFPTPESFREVERVILLRTIDKKWMDEIDDMDQLKQGIGLQAYGQRNPVDEYKMLSYDMLDQMNDAIRTETVTILYRIRIEKKVEREEVAKVTGTNKDESLQKGPVRRKTKKIYPNDPCPCGSGKKYKNCHMRQLMKTQS